MDKKRIDHLIISEIVGPGSRVLDIGCADGSLLHLLKKKKKISGQGIEINHTKVVKCLEKGLSVVEGDANKEIKNFPKDAFDYVILSQTLQTVQKPKWVLNEILRIGKKAIISFPNFGHWICRFQLCFFGRMPVTEDLKLMWYDTQNIHLCTIKDFNELINEMNLIVKEKHGINRKKNIIKNINFLSFLNLFASHVVFSIEKNSKKTSL